MMHKGGELQCGKRTSLLSLNDVFFGFQTILPKYKKKMRNLLEILGVDSVIVYGELFGGSYPHNDVKSNPMTKFVQKPLPAYCPDIEFYAFDIKTPDGFLDYDECVKVFEKSEFFYAKVLLRGSLDEMLKFGVEKFTTTIPERLGLPKIQNNFAEGVVIKTVKPQYIKKNRCIVKKKSMAFCESNGTTEEQLAKKKKQRELKYKEKDLEYQKRSENCKELMILIKGFVTENRLRSVISKIGEIKEENLSKLIGYLAKDALADFEKEYGLAFSTLIEAERSCVTKRLSDAAGTMIEKHKRDILAGDF
jgi:Rnl2 family RNA ligase